MIYASHAFAGALGDLAGRVSVGGNMNGIIEAENDISGILYVDGDVTGQILANYDGYLGGAITGTVTVAGVFNGDICAENLVPTRPLPANIQLTFGPTGTVCGEGPCIVADAPTAPADEPGFAKNRYLSVMPGNVGKQTALRVTHVASGLQWWAGPPATYCENAAQITPPAGGCGPAPGAPSLTMKAGQLQCTPHYTDWDGTLQGAPLHVFGQQVVPLSTYNVQSIVQYCNVGYEPGYSATLTVSTAKWGDIVDMKTGGQGGYWTAPDGVLDVNDTVAMLEKFSNTADAPIKSRADLAPQVADRRIDVADTVQGLNAFSGQACPSQYGAPSECTP